MSRYEGIDASGSPSKIVSGIWKGASNRTQEYPLRPSGATFQDLQIYQTGIVHERVKNSMDLGYEEEEKKCTYMHSSCCSDDSPSFI